MGMREEAVGRRVTTYNFPEVATENSTTFTWSNGVHVWTEGPYFSICYSVG